MVTPQPIQPAAWHAVYQPAAWVVLDLETTDAPDDAIQAALDAWKAPSNWKPETVESKRTEAETRIREKSALLDAAPICIVGCGTPAGIVLFTGFGPVSVDGVLVVAGSDEREMLLHLRVWLDMVASDDTEMAGHRVKPFDFPKLRQAYTRHRLHLPAVLANSDIRVFDTEQRIKGYSVELREERFIRLDEVCRVLGIDRAKQVMTGDMVPALYREGRYQDIATYSAIDVATTARAYTLLAGVANDLE